jgi:hypothetical protein
MLPFLQGRKISSIIAERRGKPPGIEVAPETEAPGQEMDGPLKTAAEDLLRAIDSKSVLDIAKALKAAFEHLDAEPHVEGEHLGDED